MKSVVANLKVERDRKGKAGARHSSLYAFRLCCLAAISLAAAGPGAAANRAGQTPYRLEAPMVFTQVPVTGRKAVPATDWFNGARVALLSPDGALRVLSEGFDSACDPDVSFDGQRVLFAAKKTPTDPWRIWETGTDGKGARAVSPDGLEARSPIYVSTLFTLDSPEPWPIIVFVGREKLLSELGTTVTSLYNSKLDGSALQRMTLNPNRNFDPLQMWDGRLVYCAEHHNQEPGITRSRTSLYAIHLEGADMELYGGEQGASVQHMPCSLPLDRVMFIEPNPKAPDGAGRLAWVSERRPHTEYGVVRQDPKYLFMYPSPLAAGRILVSRRPAKAAGNSGIYCLETGTGDSRLVFDAPQYHDLQPKILTPRPRPDGHSTVMDAKFNTGTFYCLNAYDADPKLSPHLKPGALKRARFIEGVPQLAHRQDGPFVPRRLVGEAPIEADGSFNVEVPADVPLLLQTVDERGLALANCGWIWVKPKETRGCIGCHEDPERTPENEYVQALRRPSTRLTLEPHQRRSLDFREDIAPVLARNCASADCHGSKKAALSLPLGSLTDEGALRQAYGALLQGNANPRGSEQQQPPGRFIDPGRARTSPLIWQLTGTNTSRPWDVLPAKRISQAPGATHSGPHGGLAEEELHTIVQWIDMGAPYESLVPPASLAESRQPQRK